MRKTEIDIFGIAYEKVEFIPILKIYTTRIIGRFVWSTNFVQFKLLNKFASHFQKLKLLFHVAMCFELAKKKNIAYSTFAAVSET